MKHARPDYDRIQDPAGLIPDDEPVFLLRAQDKHATHALHAYARCLPDGSEMQRMVNDHIGRMYEWPVKKEPDLPRPE